MRQFQTILCGDSLLDPTEECDDGNPHTGDGCSTLCRLEQFLELAGVAQGGTVQIVLDDEITIYGLTSSGQSAEQVVANLAYEINNNAALQSRGISAQAIGGRLVVTGELAITQISDAGLVGRLSLVVGGRVSGGHASREPRHATRSAESSIPCTPVPGSLRRPRPAAPPTRPYPTLKPRRLPFRARDTGTWCGPTADRTTPVRLPSRGHAISVSPPPATTARKGGHGACWAHAELTV